MTTRQAYDLLAQGFGPGFNGPLVVAVAMPGPDATTTVHHLQAAIAGTSGVAFVAPPQYNAARTGAKLLRTYSDMAFNHCGSRCRPRRPLGLFFLGP